jgi:cytochrome c556
MKKLNAMPWRVLAAAAVVSVAFMGAAHADDGGEIKYRKAVMKAVGGHMNALVGIVKGETANKADMAALAKGMLALAKISQNVFPKGSDAMGGDTDAKSEIWDKPDAFKKVNMAFVDHATNLVAAAESGDPKKLGAAVGALGKNACKACHDDFKKKD